MVVGKWYLKIARFSWTSNGSPHNKTTNRIETLRHTHTHTHTHTGAAQPTERQETRDTHPTKDNAAARQPKRQYFLTMNVINSEPSMSHSIHSIPPITVTDPRSRDATRLRKGSNSCSGNRAGVSKAPSAIWALGLTKYSYLELVQVQRLQFRNQSIRSWTLPANWAVHQHQSLLQHNANVTKELTLSTN